LLPTPAATPYGSSQNGINGKGGRFERPSAGTPSLSTMARHGTLPERIPAGDARSSGSRMWPTPRFSGGHDSGGGELSTYRRTPSQEAGTHGRYLQAEVIEVEIAEGRMFPTPTVSDSKGPSPNLKRDGSPNLAEFVTFPTPTGSNRDSAGGTNTRRRQRRDGTYISGGLNPTWVEWLMGFPLGWTDLGPSATRSSRRSPSGSASGS
jgi:hypothetical protein